MRKWVKTFKPEFASMVLAGTKTSTIRPFPKDGVIPCLRDILDTRMWSGKPYHSKQVQLLVFTITSVIRVIIDDNAMFITYGKNKCLNKKLPLFIMDEWAKMDGFKSWDDMYAWFGANYKLPFLGIRIKWEYNKAITQ